MIPADTIESILQAVAQHFGYDPNRALPFWREQARCEGAYADTASATFNPLNCTQPLPGSTAFNDAGVQNYASLTDGVKAIIWTLDPQSVNPAWVDYYPTIRASLGGATVDRTRLAAQLDLWGTHAFADEIRNGAWSYPAVINAPAPAPTEPEADRINAAVLARFREVAYAFRAFYGVPYGPDEAQVSALLARLDAAADAEHIPDA